MIELANIVFSFFTLSILEIVLGIDNLVLLAIISRRLPKHQQAKARKWGLTFAWVTRLILLASAVWLTKLTQPLFTIFQMGFSGRDIFLIIGGIFLLVKATQEIHMEFESLLQDESPSFSSKHISFTMAITQIAFLDIIFSLDSVLTAVGLTQHFWLMAAAITVAILAMLYASEILSAFIEAHPSIKMLALSFLILIGMVLLADGFHFHIPRGYVYFAMAFSLLVETLNLMRRKKLAKAGKSTI